MAFSWGIGGDELELYYAAAVRSMAGSWHDFVFGAFDPGGTLSLDKLPGGLWPQALSVRLFGVSTWAMVLPQVLEGVATVLVLYRAVRRLAGPAAGLAAAAVLTATPVTVALGRGNVPDTACVLGVVLAADAVTRAVSDGRLRPLVAAGVWVGLAFQAKMAEAWLVAPALATAYLVAAPGGRWRRWRRVLLAGAVMAAVSLAWAVAVTLVPDSARPAVDGSRHDSVVEQVFVYNGTARFGSSPAVPPSPALPSQAVLGMGLARRLLASLQPAAALHPGWDRLVSGRMAGEVGWLLPTALAVAVVGVAARGRRRRGDPVRTAFLLWGGWLVTVVAALSATRELHGYYLGMAAPAVAAVVGVGQVAALRAVAAARLRRRLAPVVVCAASLAWCCWLLEATGAQVGRAAAGVVGVVGGAAVVAWAVALGRGRRRPRRWVVAAAAGTLALVVAAPATASVWLLAHDGGPFALPFTATGGGDAGAAARAVAASTGLIVAPLTGQQWGALADRAERVDALAPPGGYGLAVLGAPAAVPYVLGGARSVLPIGGLSGGLGAPDIGRLRSLLRRHLIAFAYLPGLAAPAAYDPRAELIAETCREVPEPAAATVPPQSRAFAARLYDCR